MTTEPRIITIVNNVYFYLVISLLSLVAIYLSVSILLIPVVATVFDMIEEKKDEEFDVYRHFLKKILEKFKLNIKSSKYCIFSVYYFISIYAVSVSTSFAMMFANIFVSIALMYIIIVIADILTSNETCGIKKVYQTYIFKYTNKQKIDLFMLVTTFSLLMFFGYIKIFMASMLLFIYISYNILRKEVHND
ncbi:hypothetical protein RZE82_06600 [Mollicutes bacterium LVI A0039]|nr:hypothetical protein RZE82_06600 [Mollicutes bacterium LVI A0039]